MKINKVFFKLIMGITLLIGLIEGAFVTISISEKKKELLSHQKMEFENYGTNKIFSKYYVESELNLVKIYLSYVAILTIFTVIGGSYFFFYNIVGKYLAKIIMHNKNGISFDPAFITNDLPNDEIGELILMRERMLKNLRGKVEENRSLTKMLVHDIGSALSVVIGNAEILLRQTKKNDVEVLEYRLNKILKASIAQKNLIERVRHLEALGSNKAAIVLKQFSLNEILRDSIDLFEDVLLEKKVKINFTPHIPDSAYLYADDVLLFNNVINNLISNAIKFSTSESTIEISSFQEIKNMLSFKVKDSGIGIPQELIAKIFSTDLKTSREGTHGEKGTGLGLPLAFSTIKILNGEIIVTSKSIEEDSTDHWTMFQVNLPQVES